MNNLQLLLIIVVSLLMTTLAAQDIHFSQFNLSPLNLNPAMTGAINGDTRLQANYRNQWSQVLRGDAYNTFSGSFDRRKDLANQDFIGWGGLGNIDRAGELSFGTTQGTGSLTYGKNIGSDSTWTHYLVLGGQFGITQRRIDASGLRWGPQHDGDGGFDHIPGFSPDFLHADFNVGLMWMSTFRNRHSLYLGIASHHINRPNISFYDNNTQTLTVRTTIHGGGEIAIATPVSIAPSFSYMSQGVHRQLNIGTYLRLNDEDYSGLSFVQAGMFYRVGKNSIDDSQASAFIITASAKYKALLLSIAYDFPRNDLRQAGTFNGALELTAGLLFSGNKSTRIRLPKMY